MIRQYLFVVFAALVAVTIQTTLSKYVFQSYIRPDFIFIMVVLLGFFKNSSHGALMSFILGALEDIFIPQILGLFMCARISTYFVATRLSVRFSPKSPLWQFAFALGLGIFDKLLVMGLLFLFSTETLWEPRVFVVLGTEIVINALFTPFLYPLFAWFPGLLDTGDDRVRG